MTTVALTIAGSDPSGGAGIQADLRTFAALGVVGVSVITALTVQNSLGVQSVHPVPADVLAAQLEAILSDTKVQAVKIGMLGGADQVRAVAAALRKYAPPNIVLDPVLASTGGVPLLDEEGRAALLTELMPLCDLVTPNLSEAAVLTGLSAYDPDTMRTAGDRLLSLGVRAALVKGGHLNGDPVDVLIYVEDGLTLCDNDLSSERINTEHTHGTGCALSAGIAALLAQGEHIWRAVSETKTWLFYALKSPVVVGKGRGYPDIGLAPAKRLDIGYQEKLSLLRGVYVVTDANLNLGRSHQDVLRAAYSGDVTVVQYREKSLPFPALIRSARKLRLDVPMNALLIVNDRVDVALASKADGVHLGPDDMPPRYAREVMGPHKIIGVSIATVGEAKAAAPYASYFGVGAIFGSKTKLDAGEPIGVGRIREIKAAFPDIPIVAIGGINAENIALVAQAGADAAAVVSAVVAAPDMEVATRELVARFEAGKATGIEMPAYS